jgi:hypothetical protein
VALDTAARLSNKRLSRASEVTMATQHAIDEADIRQRIDKLAEAVRVMDLVSVMSIYTTDVAISAVHAPDDRVDRRCGGRSKGLLNGRA